MKKFLGLLGMLLSMVLTTGCNENHPPSFVDVAIDASGKIYLADKISDRIWIVDENGKVIKKTFLTRDFVSIRALAIDNSRDILYAVSSFGPNGPYSPSIFEFPLNGEKIREFYPRMDTNTYQPLRLRDPRGIAVDSQGNIYITDEARYEEELGIIKFSPEGALRLISRKNWHSLGRDNFYAITIDSRKNIWIITNSCPGTVIKISATGELLAVDDRRLTLLEGKGDTPVVFPKKVVGYGQNSYIAANEFSPLDSCVYKKEIGGKTYWEFDIKFNEDIDDYREISIALGPGDRYLYISCQNKVYKIDPDTGKKIKEWTF